MFTYVFEDAILTRPLALWVTLIGAGAFFAGTFSLVWPEMALSIYGLSTRAQSSQKSPEHGTSKNYEPIARSLSIRNVTLGLSILVLVDYWQRAGKRDAEAGKAVQVCLGYIITIGSLAPATDAYGAWVNGSDDLRLPTFLLHTLRLCAWLGGAVACLYS